MATFDSLYSDFDDEEYENAFVEFVRVVADAESDTQLDALIAAATDEDEQTIQ